MDSECTGCRIAHCERQSLKLGGGWTLNHYGGTEGFFGWLALQPCRHRATLRDLDSTEAQTLGPNLRKLEHGIYQYWQDVRSKQVDRVYIMYFLEGQLEAAGEQDHLHIHLVPRFQGVASLMESEGGIDAYKIARLHLNPSLPAFMNRQLVEEPERSAREFEIARGVWVAAGFTE